MSTELQTRLNRLQSRLAEIEEGGVQPNERARYNVVQNRIRDVEALLRRQGGPAQNDGTNNNANAEQARDPIRLEEQVIQANAGELIRNEERECGSTNDLDRRDPADPDFWDKVRVDARTLLNGWLTGQLLNALTEFETHMATRSSSGSNDGAIVISLLMSGMSFTLVDGATGFVSKVTGIVGKALTFSGTASPRVRYNDFVSRMHTHISDLERSIANGTYEALQHLSEQEIRETEQNRTEVRRSALEQLNSAACQLPNKSRLLRNMVTAWIDGAEDEPAEGGDWGRHDAGYIYCKVHLTWGVGHRLTEVQNDPSIMLFNFKKAHIDDVANQAGTIEAVRQAFGADTYLDMLPIPMTIEVRYTGPNYRETHRYEKAGRSREHSRGWRAAGRSEEAWMRAFLQHPYRPKTSDLVED
jgi:hypothetical protein